VKRSRYSVFVEVDGADYAYSGMSGALLRLGRGERDSIERFLAGESDAGCSSVLLTELAKGRMLVSDGTDELDLLATRYRRGREDSTHLALTIVTSLGCNFDCPYCFEDKHPSILDAEVEDALLALVDDNLPQIQSMHVGWFGGEPLVGKRPLVSLSRQFIDRCDRAGVWYSADIITNGYMLDAQTCRELAELRVNSCQVTLDGPPDVHNRMRPLAGGGPSFDRIVENLQVAVDHFDVAVRVNVDTQNYQRAEELLQILAGRGLSGRMQVYLGQLVAVSDGPAAPSSSYQPGFFAKADFAAAELEFTQLAMHYGFSGPSVPQPVGAPCTAVKVNEFIVGSKGELYKCWQSVGNPTHVTGNVRDYANQNGRLQRWLKYDPFSNDECRSCVALPVCMGGCAHHGMDALQYENRCGTFRYNYVERIEQLARAAQSTQTPVSVAIAAPASG